LDLGGLGKGVYEIEMKDQLYRVAGGGAAWKACAAWEACAGRAALCALLVGPLLGARWQFARSVGAGIFWRACYSMGGRALRGRPREREVEGWNGNNRHLH
jgi:hypothetical protein